MRTKLLIAVSAAVALVFAARANTITPTVAAWTPGVSIVYQANLSSGELHAGDGFTIFDIGGFLGFGPLAPGWIAAAAPLGSPWGVAPGGPDTADMNVTFTYTGPAIEASVGPALPFIPFTVFTTSLSLVTDDWTSRDHLLGVTGVIDGALGSPHTDEISVPAHVPDGGLTLALLGFALMGVERVRRRLSH